MSQNLFILSKHVVNIFGVDLWTWEALLTLATVINMTDLVSNNPLYEEPQWKIKYFVLFTFWTQI